MTVAAVCSTILGEALREDFAWQNVQDHSCRIVSFFKREFKLGKNAITLFDPLCTI